MALVSATGLSGDVTFAIAGGADSDRFTLDPATGALSFRSAPDFEVPTDAGQDDRCDVIVKMHAGAEIRAHHITVAVEDVKGVAIDARF